MWPDLNFYSLVLFRDSLYLKLGGQSDNAWNWSKHIQNVITDSEKRKDSNNTYYIKIRICTFTSRDAYGENGNDVAKICS